MFSEDMTKAHLYNCYEIKSIRAGIVFLSVFLFFLRAKVHEYLYLYIDTCTMHLI